MSMSRFWKCAVIVCAAGVSGCAASIVEDPMEKPTRVVTLVSDDVQLTAEIQQGETSITVHLLRGPPRVDGWFGDLVIDPPFEVNLLVTDQNGSPVLAEVGGDLLPGDWADAFRIAPSGVLLDGRRVDLDIALEAASLLEADQRVAPLFHWHLSALRNLAHDALDDETFHGKLITGEPTPSFSDAVRRTLVDIQTLESEGTTIPRADTSDDSWPVGPAASESIPLSVVTYQHRADIRKATCCWSFGQHSAVQVRTYNSAGNSLLITVNTNNHGRSASDPSMTSSSGCPKTWSGRTNLSPPTQPFLGMDNFSSGNAGGCGTSYGTTSGTHVCNDDSAAEYWHVKYNASASWVTCGDQSLRSSAPSCD